ncbi:hypothetical protein JM16_006374 [Phytophthora kernoviae]|uniref:VPS9 domain-containing protein n=1 Tax=Phytophthora kernoviae TaxID=325452 RepID=A0A8T0LVH6_9STRA|nr:hypothetical protein JM16_006374 [Phytophthora kernoviae]
MRRKRRRAPTIELQSTNQPENEPLCTASDQEDDEEDDDGADALIAAFGAENNPQEQEQEQEQDPNKRLGRKKTLAHTTSASMLRVCKCGRVSRASSVGEEIREDFDPHSASREYLDLHIRYAVVVRVVRVEPVNGRTVFVIRVKDAETQKKWEMKKSLKEMMLFYAQIQQISMVDAPMNASQLVDDIFAAPSHKVPRSCEAFVTVLTRMSLNDKHMCMPDRKARTLLNTVSRKMGEIKHTMLEDEALLTQLAVARSERTEPDYDEFLDEVKHAVGGFVQKRVLVPLEDYVHEALHTITDWDDERVLQDKVKALQTKSQSFFGVPPHVAAGSSSDWEDARRELRRVNEYALPLDKLKCLARAAGAIFQTCGSSRSSSSVGTAFSLTSVEELDMMLRPSLTTDEFISVNLFVLVMSNLSQLLITREFLRVMCDAQDITGELGYYLTTFEVAVDLLIKHADPQQPMLP